MLEASEVKAGSVLRLDKDFHKVLEAVVHAGGGKAGSMVHLKLRNLSNGHISEKRFNTTDKVEDIEVARVKMQLIFREGDAFNFMNQQTFDQIPIPRAAVGAAADYLKENDECEVEFYEDKPLAILYAPVVELKIQSAGEGVHGQTKEAITENGLAILVPHFIKEGDRVHVDVETGKYLDRVSDREAKGAKFTTAAPKVKGGKAPEAPAAPAAAPAAEPAKPKADAKPEKKPKV